MEQYKYDVFISYSHADKKYGNWLFKSLRRYKVPKQLVGKKNSRSEIIPNKFSKIFRDKNSTPAHSNLPKLIQNALSQSKYLIVICSPNSRSSEWVNEEIKLFKKIHGEEKVLALIVDGVANASFNESIDNALESFPKALQYKINIHGELTTERTDPLAANINEDDESYSKIEKFIEKFLLLSNKGETKAKIKLIGGLLGLEDLESLYNEELEREKRQNIFFLVAFLFVCFLLCFSLYQWSEAKKRFMESEYNLGTALYEKANYFVESHKYEEAILLYYEALNKIKNNNLTLKRSIENKIPTLNSYLLLRKKFNLKIKDINYNTKNHNINILTENKIYSYNTNEKKLLEKHSFKNNEYTNFLSSNLIYSCYQDQLRIKLLSTKEKNYNLDNINCFTPIRFNEKSSEIYYEHNHKITKINVNTGIITNLQKRNFYFDSFDILEHNKILLYGRGKFLILGSNTNEMVFNLDEESYLIKYAGSSKKGKVLISLHNNEGFEKSKISIYDIKNNQKIFETLIAEKIYSSEILLSKDERYLAINLTSQSKILLIDINTKEEFHIGLSNIDHMKFSDEYLIVTSNNSVSIYNPFKKKVKRITSNEILTKVDINNNATKYLTSSSSEINIYDSYSHNLIKKIDLGNKSIYIKEVYFIKNNSKLLVIDENNHLLIWDIIKEQEQYNIKLSYKFDSSDVKYLMFDEKNNSLYSDSINGKVEVSPKYRNVVKNHFTTFTYDKIIESETTNVIIYKDNKLLLQKILEGQHIMGIKLSSTRRFLAYWNHNTLFLWDIKMNKLIQYNIPWFFKDFNFSGNDEKCIGITENGMIIMFDIKSYLNDFSATNVQEHIKRIKQKFH